MIEFKLSDFDAFNGGANYDDVKIQNIQRKLKMLKIPLHKKFKNKYGIDFKSNIGGHYPPNYPINSLWLSFTQREGRAYVPYPQLNVEINAKGIEIFFLLVDKARVKTGQRIWEIHCNKLKNGLNKNHLLHIKENDFKINRDNDIDNALKVIDPYGLWIYKNESIEYAVNLKSGTASKIFETLEQLYPIYMIAMASKIK